jgi:predicted nucleic acid-binding protein
VRNVWQGDGPVLVDTSAWTTARRMPGAQDLLLAAIERGDVAWSWPVRYELMIDARNESAIHALDRVFESLREVRLDWALQQQVLAFMRDLARAGSHGAHRFPLTDLSVVVAAQAAGLGVLHFDRHLAHLCAFLGVASWWLADPGES